jgi:hypothetical protein
MAKSTLLTPPPRVQALAATLSHPQPMRRGSLSERWTKCGKPGCPCATDPTARHGPYFSVTRAVQGQTMSRYVTPEEAVVVRRQIEAAHAFRKEVAAVWAACEAWADEELDAAAPARPEGGEKGGSTRRSPRKLRPRSQS